MPTPLRLAIIGGSISGCTLANALLGYDNITFDLFESKDNFRERGAAIAMHTNALGALRCMGLGVDRILKDGHANKRDVLHTIIGCGANKGKEFLETIEGPWGIGRQQLLDELVKPLPQERLHCNKKLLTITEEPSQKLVLHFADGTTHSADAVIGCDGFRSQIRKIILGDDHPAASPIFAGFWDARGLLPTAQAVEQFGTNLIDPRKPQLSAVAGNGCFTLSGQIAGGEMYFVTVSGAPPEGWNTSAWKGELNREHLEETYKEWDAQFRKGVIEAVMSSGPGVVFNQWESPSAPTYFRGRICMMGDAAHSTSNWLGQGAAMAIEDCAVLADLFRTMTKVEDFDKGFNAFDHVRRNGRPDIVIEQSRLLGKILTGQMGLDPDKVKGFGMQAKREEILNYDVRKELHRARERYDELQAQRD